MKTEGHTIVHRHYAASLTVIAKENMREKNVEGYDARGVGVARSGEYIRVRRWMDE